MRLVSAVFALCAFGSLAFAEDDTLPSVPPPMKTSIEISKALTPVQKIAALEDGLNKETDRRVEMEATVESQKNEIARLVTAQVALNREKSSAESELGKTREALARAQRDFETLRVGYTVVTKIIGYSYPVIAGLVLFILVLLGWLLFVTRSLAVRVHDVPTLRQMHEYQDNLAHLQEQLAVEKNRTDALKERLSMLGVVD
jgi:septal ring factor EnvC (AmiA/AmiB activator)